MKEKHVILRTIGSPIRMPGASPAGGAASLDPTELVVEIEAIESAKIPDVTRHRDVLAVAPVMPLKLVQPMEAPAGQPAAGNIDWGVHAVGADTSAFTGDGVIVAVLDTGIDPAHPAFMGVTLVRENFTDDANGSDQHGHGTHCAGTIFGRDVDGTRIGVAPGVKKALIGKVLGANGGPSDQVVRAMQWAVSEGATVISMSLGMDFPGYQKQLTEQLGFPPELATSRALEGYRLNVLLFERLASTIRALGAMTQQPTIIVAAAGNESQTNVNPDFKIAVSPPAVSDGFISVAALAQDAGGLFVAPFSNTGAMVAGPGVAITSARMGGGLRAMSGTSMATPHVAGVAALWTQKLKAIGPMSAELLAATIVTSAHTTGFKPGFDRADVGTGLVQAPQN